MNNLNTMDELIITVAPNGAYKQAADHPALPLTPASLAATAKQCCEAGAAMLHLHIRDAAGRQPLCWRHERSSQSFTGKT